MTDRTFQSMEPIIAPNVPGCPPPTIIQFVRSAAIEVCERTLAWRVQQPDITLTPGTYSYNYETLALIPTDSEVCGVFHATVNGQVIDPLTQERLHRLYPKWPATDAEERSQPLNYAHANPDEFVLAPVPDDAETYLLRMFLALRPTPTATGMEKIIFDELERVIEHAALQRLLILPDRSWTDRELATYHAKQLSFKLSMRRAKASIGNARGSVFVEQVPWA